MDGILLQMRLSSLHSLHSFSQTGPRRWMMATLLSLGLANLQGCSSLASKEETEWTVQEFYGEAKSAFETEYWEVAINYYEKLKAYYPYGKYAEQSYLELAYAYYRFDEPESAKLELEEFIRLYPKHSELAYAYYLRALAADSINRSYFDSWFSDPADRDMASTQEAYEAYFTLLQRFPNTDYTPKARERLIILRNQMARHELLVGQYYFNRRAYLAAANRSKVVLERYPKTQSAQKALALLHASYQKLGMKQNAIDTQKVIDFNTPSNP